jgi:hypothetical protein
MDDAAFGRAGFTIYPQNIQAESNFDRKKCDGLGKIG